MRAIIYARKSTDDARSQKSSIEDQRKWADRYIEGLRADGKEVVIVARLEEKKSAKQPWRPLFGEMMGLIYEGKADTIITWDIDRLSRNEVDEGTIKWAIRKDTIAAVHTHSSVYWQNELLVMSMFFAVSAEEIKKLRERATRRDLEVLRSWGIPYPAPLGYRHIGGGMVEPDEYASFVRDMFRMRAKGKSYQEIADDLHVLGLRTKGGRKVGKSTVESVIKNEFYIGVTHFMNEYGQGIYAKIVPMDVWKEANGMKCTTSGYVHRSFVFKGIAYSSRTKKRLTASLIKKKYVYYYEHGDDGCKVKISETDIVERFGEAIHLYDIPDDLTDVVRKAIKDWSNGQDDAVLSDTKTIDRKLAEVRDTEKSLKNKFVSDSIDSPYYHERLSELAKQKALLLEDREQYFIIDTQNALILEKTVKLLTRLSDTWKTADYETRRGIVQTIAVKLEIDEEKRLTIHEKEPFYWLSLMNFQEWLHKMETIRTVFQTITGSFYLPVI